MEQPLNMAPRKDDHKGLSDWRKVASFISDASGWYQDYPEKSQRYRDLSSKLTQFVETNKPIELTTDDRITMLDSLYNLVAYRASVQSSNSTVDGPYTSDNMYAFAHVLKSESVACPVELCQRLFEHSEGLVFDEYFGEPVKGQKISSGFAEKILGRLYPDYRRDLIGNYARAVLNGEPEQAFYPRLISEEQTRLFGGDIGGTSDATKVLDKFFDVIIESENKQVDK